MLLKKNRQLPGWTVYHRFVSQFLHAQVDLDIGGGVIAPIAVQEETDLEVH